MVRIKAADNAGSSQGFEAPHVRFDVALHIAAGDARSHPRDLEMLRGFVVPIVAGRERGNGRVHRSCRGSLLTVRMAPIRASSGARVTLSSTECTRPSTPLMTR